MAKKVIAIAFAWFVATIALLVLTLPAHADCHAFFRKHYVQQYYAAAYVQPVVYAPLVFYQAGDELRIQAAVRRELDYQQNLQAPSKGYQSPQQAPIQAPIQAPKGSLQPLQQVPTGVFAKCARCHTGDKAAGGLVLDGQTPTTCENYRRFGEIFGLGENIPAKMQAIVPTLTDQEKGALNEAVLRLVAVEPRPVQPLPQVDRPPPPPVPEPEAGGLH
jgi:hypothetical protein